MKDIDLTKEILSGKEIREKLLKGIETVYKSVGSISMVILGLQKMVSLLQKKSFWKINLKTLVHNF